MQLTYRGINYNATPAFSAAEISGLTATYRGVSYNLLKRMHGDFTQNSFEILRNCDWYS